MNKANTVSEQTPSKDTGIPPVCGPVERAMGVAVCDPEGRVIWANEALERLLGMAAGALRGQQPAALPVWRDTALPAFLERARQADAEQACTVTIKWPDGAHADVSVRSVPCREAGAARFLLLVEGAGGAEGGDGTRDRRDQFRGALASMATAAFMCARDRFVYLNPAALRLFGADDEAQLVGQPVLDRLHPDSRDAVRRRKQFVTERRLAAPPQEEVYVDLAGRPVEVEVSAWPYEPAGEHGAIVFAREIGSRRRTEEALRASEQRYRSLLEASQGLVWSMDVAGRFTGMNDASLRMLGIEPRAMIGRPFTDFIAPASRDEAWATFRRQMESTTPTVDIELEALRPDGRVLLTRTTAVPIRNDEGRVTGITGTTQDFTEHRRAERALQESEARYRHLVESSSDWIWEIDAQYRYTYASPRVTEILGYAPGELIGRSPFDLMPPGERERVRSVLFTYARACQPFRGIENTKLHRDGRQVVNESAGVPFFDDAGRLLGFRGNDRDITVHRATGLALRLSEARLRQAQEVGRIGDWELDAATGALTCSAQMRRLLDLGDEREALTRAELLDRYEPGDRARLAEAIDRAIRTSASMTLDLFAREGDGLHCHEMVIQPLEDEAGNVVRLRGIAQDVTARRKNADDLARSRDFYLTLFQDFPAMIWRAGPDLSADYFNRTWLEFTGRGLEQEKGRGWLEGVHADDRAGCESAVQAAARRRLPYEVEYRLLHRDGDYRWVMERAKPYHDLDGAFAGYIGVCHDITERRRVEDQLRLLSAALEVAANAMIITDHAGRIVWVNEAFTSLTGYAALDVIGQTPRLLKSGLQDDAFYANLWRTILAGRVWRGEVVNRRIDGRLYTEEMTITPVPNRAGEITHFVAIKQDITQQRRDAERLRERVALLNLAQESITVRDMQDRVTFWNAGAERLFGCSAGQALGRTMRVIVPGLDEKGLQEARRIVVVSGYWSGEIEMVLRGERRILDSKWTLIRDSAGRPGAVMCVETDITEKKRFAEHFASADRMRSLGTLVSGIAHDFNNLLMPILGLSEMLMQNPEQMDQREEAVNHLRIINSAARDARDIVTRLREFYRPSEKMESSPLDLAHIVREVASLTEPRWKTQAQVEGRQIELRLDIRPVPPTYGQPARLREALINVLLNAVDAMPAGGVITLRVMSVLNRAVIEVRDTGIGMADEVRRRCLEPFFSTKGVYGSGLGLSVCHGVVERHDGLLEIESKPGQGTVVRISLPGPRAAVEPVASALPAAGPLRPLRVLAIDDDELTRDMLRLYLKSEGHHAEIAADGAAGLQRLAEETFDLLICDRAMPGMNGDRVAVEARRMYPGLVIILLTGFGGLMVANDEKPEGVDLVLGKPVTRDELRAAMADATADARRRTPSPGG